MLRLGKKKKTPKGYYYRLFSDGTLLYFKKVKFYANYFRKVINSRRVD